MAVEKLSISFDPALARQVRDLADEQDETVSAFLAEAARERVRQLLLAKFVAELAAERGLSEDEMAEEGRRILAEEGEWVE